MRAILLLVLLFPGGPWRLTGVHCEVDIDECQSSPCRNGATCADGANSYTCLCPEPQPGQEPWGGRDCDVPLVGCQEHLCQHGATCVPLLSEDKEHIFACLCPPGWAGELCNISTTFSFNSKAGYIRVLLPVAENRIRRAERDPEHGQGLQVQLRFRTTLPDMVLYHRGNAEHFVSLEMSGGLLRARVSARKSLEVTHRWPVNDGEWHTADVSVDERLVLVVRGPGCLGEDGCTIENKAHNHLLFLQSSSFRQLYVGGVPEEYTDGTIGGQRGGFVGCMEDLRVEGRLLMPQDLRREENIGMELGCYKRDWCAEDPCSQRGKCVDMWVRASCECHRPYYGESCQQELPSWTFSREGASSYAAFPIGESHRDNFTISFLLRSLKRGGLLLQLSRGGKPYLTVYLKEGAVAIYSPHTTLLSEAGFVTDGHSRLVELEVRFGNVVFPAAGDHRALGNVSVEAGDVAHVGGLPTGGSLASWGGYFKGCLQDVRLDHKQLTVGAHPPVEDVEVYASSEEKDVLRGCQSDETCKDEPCLNGGQCEVTWNDYRCICPNNFTGRICETRLWCVDEPCPAGARCVDLRDGYECLTDATLQDNALQYAANGSLVDPVTSITVDLRTRDESGVLLRSASRGEVFCLGLLNSSLLVKLRSGESPTLLAFTSERNVADGAWHRIHLAMVDPVLPTSRWRLTVDGQRAGGSLRVGGNLNFLNSSEVWLAQNFTGCLGEVRVGGVYLPLTEVPPDRPQASRFSRLGGHPPTAGCRGDPVCQSQPCLNEGVCQDQFNDFNCSCRQGWEGDFCQTETDECSSGPCVYGTCTDMLADYRCQCEPGYTGKDCREEVDNCLEFSCRNGGTCRETVGTHTCACPPGYTGKRCQWRFPPVACDANTECLNGGVCMGGIWGGNCSCKPGYVGDRCETETDECASSPCLNGATCLDRLNHFQCMCATGFSGRLCESNKMDHLEGVHWLLVAIPLASLCALLAILAVFVLVMTARKKRQSEGTYSPSAQEVAGARLEMGSVLKVPPEERLI